MTDQSPTGEPSITRKTVSPISLAVLSRQRFGAHMSIAGGLANAFDLGAKVGCDCLQIFVKNQRQWRASPLADADVDRFRRAAARTGLAPVVAHAGYLINLASDNSATADRSRRALIDELQRCEALGLRHLVMHPGSHLGAGLREGIRRIITGLDAVHHATAGFAVRILLETTAGQGTSIGWEFEHLRRILDGVADADRLRVCLDTCHLFAAGYDIARADGYEAMGAELDAAIGIGRVECIHVNDSKRECGSRVDRHEHITKGRIGRTGFSLLVNDVRLAAIPKILETPKGRDGRGTDLDKVNLKRLRGLIAGR
jgi:deoxyribonuclease-4